MLQEFDIEIKDRKGRDKVVTDHLSRSSIEDLRPIRDTFPNEQILDIQVNKLA